MKETYIKFNPAMVRAILEGRKTQTRRLFKPSRTGEHKCPYGNLGDKLLVQGPWDLASGITLQIELVRMERLNEITREDCIAEGLEFFDGRPVNHHGWRYDVGGLVWQEPHGAFRELWESINGPGSWDDNPWVWVIHFRRLQ